MPAWLPLDLIHFQRPLWLWTLMLVPLPWLLWRLRRGVHLERVVDAHLLPHLVEPATGTAGWRLLGVSLGLLLSALALAGPGWRKEVQPRWQNQTPLVIALDLSPAITTPDLAPSRLAQARAKIASLLALRVGGEVGLVAWGEDAYTVAPLTPDAANIALYLDALEPDIMPVAGHRPERALTHAASLLRQAGFEGGQILLMTGQVDDAARRVGAALAQQGYQVSVLGLGTPAGAHYRGSVDGQTRHAALDEPGLRALAQAAGGRYARLQVDAGDLRQLGLLDGSDTQAVAAQAGGEQVWLDQGYWLLWPLLLLAALAFRRGAGLFAVLPLALCLSWATPGTALARDAQGGSLWQRPDQQAQVHIQQGVEAYRRGDFQAAADAFGKARARGPEAEYNLGNALARLGRYDEAIAAYDRALAQQAGMGDARANRAVVEAARRRQPPPAGQKPPQDGKNGQQSAEAGQPGGQGQPGDTGGNGERPPADRPPAGTDRPQERGQDGARSEQDSEQDAQARQAEADRLQRERMEQALQQAGAASAPSMPVATEDPAAAEQRMAREAWLRRVPDDPGGLLRAKFRLEYERRERERR
jgi:Ca-activated chloride channel family protein